MSDDIVTLMEDKGAILRDHFRLSSGRHSDLFVQKFRVLEDPVLAAGLGSRLAGHFEGAFDVVAAPAVGAIVLGFSVGLAAEKRVIFAERVEGDMAFRRGFELAKGERVLVVEDVITTGGSAREVVELVEEAGGEVVGVAALIDRGDPSRPPELGAPLTSLARLTIDSWDEAECPLCEGGVALQDPGSRRSAP